MTSSLVPPGSRITMQATGGWLVASADGQVGGVFASERAARWFTRMEKLDHAGADVHPLGRAAVAVDAKRESRRAR